MSKVIFQALIIVSTILAIGGCSSVSEAGYYWGKYPYTYLETIRSPSPESTEKHITELREIVKYSEEKELKPAPGIYAELAFWLSKSENGNDTEVTSLFNKEMLLYPESRTFIERLISK